MPRITKVYTRTGDDGTTGLGGTATRSGASHPSDGGDDSDGRFSHNPNVGPEGDGQDGEEVCEWTA